MDFMGVRQSVHSKYFSYPYGPIEMYSKFNGFYRSHISGSGAVHGKDRNTGTFEKLEGLAARVC